MVRRVLFGMLWAVPAYFVVAVVGGYLVYLTSTNRYDRAMEAEMTGAFVLGPVAAVVGFLAGAVRGPTARRGRWPGSTSSEPRSG